MDANTRETMKQLLFNLGIIDASHLAAIPCSLVYDYALEYCSKIRNTQYMSRWLRSEHCEVDDDDWNPTCLEHYQPRHTV